MMPLSDPPPDNLPSRLRHSLVSRWRGFRSLPVLHPTGVTELWREKGGGHPADRRHDSHLLEALNWLTRAQDATPNDGIARGYSIFYNTRFRSQGWQPSYPATTGLIIPSFFEASRSLRRPDLAERAIRAARWESAIQLPEGAVQGGVIGDGRTPAVFNTGQVCFGWLAAWEETGQQSFADSARQAGAWLVDVMDEDGHWRGGNSKFTRNDATLYNARVAWALAEVGRALDEPDFVEAARRNLIAVADLQRENGWFPNCCLTDPAHPLLHTLAYTIRGLLEGGRVLKDDRLLLAGARAADALLATVREDGWMPGRYNPDWSPAVEWSCLTGQAQMATNWMRLHMITGEPKWMEHVPAVLTFLKTTQNRTSDDPGLRGGIKGSNPMSGEYGRYEILNWATKYFMDAMIRHDLIESRDGKTDGDWFRLG